MRAVRADGSADDPAALTLFAFCLFDSNFKLAAVVLDHNLGNDKRRSQLVLCFLEESKLVAACTKRNLRLEGALDGLVLDNGFKGLLDVVSQSVNLVPVCHEAVVDIEVELRGHLVKDMKKAENELAAAFIVSEVVIEDNSGELEIAV